MPILLLLLIFCSGCVMPLPHSKTICGPVSGYVIDMQNQEPLAAALVWIQYPDASRRHTFTDQQGYFAFANKKVFRMGVKLGATDSMAQPISIVQIDIDDYYPVRIIFPYGHNHRPWDHYRIIEPELNFDEKNRHWHWPLIKLHKIGQ